MNIITLIKQDKQSVKQLIAISIIGVVLGSFLGYYMLKIFF